MLSSSNKWSWIVARHVSALSLKMLFPPSKFDSQCETTEGNKKNAHEKIFFPPTVIFSQNHLLTDLNIIHMQLQEIVTF